MTTIINGSSPSITFSDSTTQSTGISSVNPVFTGDASISGLTVGKGGGAVSSNTVAGYQTLNSNTSGSNRTAIGYKAGYSGTTTNNTTHVGFQAGLNTTGDNNTVVGAYAHQTNSTGVGSSVFGVNAMYYNSTGSYHVAIGQDALQNNTTASSNTAVGYQAGFSNQTGSNSVMVGYQSGYAGTDHDFNVGVGYRTLYSTTTADYNTAIGGSAFQSVTTGANNTALGYQAGSNLTTGNYNVFIGQGVQASSASVTQEMVMGFAGAVGKGNYTGYIASSSTYNGGNSTTWNTTSDQRLKKNIVDNNTGLDKITKIQIRNFEYRLPEEIIELDPVCAINRKGVQLGVIAQEIQQVSSEFVKEESTGVLSVDSDNLVWYLINAVKELNAKVTALEEQVINLEVKLTDSTTTQKTQ